jgi:hypothetical protein
MNKFLKILIVAFIFVSCEKEKTEPTAGIEDLNQTRPFTHIAFTKDSLNINGVTIGNTVHTYNMQTGVTSVLINEPGNYNFYSKNNTIYVGKRGDNTIRYFGSTQGTLNTQHPINGRFVVENNVISYVGVQNEQKNVFNSSNKLTSLANNENLDGVIKAGNKLYTSKENGVNWNTYEVVNGNLVNTDFPIFTISILTFNNTVFYTTYALSAGGNLFKKEGNNITAVLPQNTTHVAIAGHINNDIYFTAMQQGSVKLLKVDTNTLLYEEVENYPTTNQMVLY